MARQAKPYRLTFRKDTGFWYYKLRGLGWKSTGCSKEHEAIAHVLEVLGRGPEISTLRSFASGFFVWGSCPWIRGQHASGRPFSRAVARDRRNHLVRHIFPKFGDLPLNRIKVVEVEAWLYDLPLANQTRNHIIDTFRIVLDEAVRQELIERDPLDKIRRPAHTYRKRDILTPQEIVKLFPRHKPKLLKVWKNEPMWATLFYLMLTSGIRVGEVAALQWKHIIWSSPAVLQVERAVKADGQVGLPKSNDLRAIFLPRRTKWTLAWWRELSAFPELEDLVFFGQWRDRPMNRKTISKRFPFALEDAGILRGDRYLTAHSLRHTYVTHCRQTLPAALVAFMTGHKSEALQDRYTALTPAERLRALLPEPPAIEQIWN